MERNPEIYIIVFSPGALKDMGHARLWYNQQQKGLGRKFVADVKEVIRRIKQNPYSASIKYENVRTAACKTFPYSVHFEIDDTLLLIRIVSVFHFNRNPYWLE